MIGKLSMKIAVIGALAASFLGLAGLHASKALAVSGSDWQASRIIDDSVFFNPNTMSSQDIQNFLNSKVPTCDTNGTQPISSGSSQTRAQWAAANGKPQPPYTCLKDYSQNVSSMAADSYCGAITGGSMSAATIIKTVAAACNLNPQVILVLLQKEQSLVTDDWPWPIEYQAATGYGCPDTASCDPSFSGFFNQVYYGARQYQQYAKNPQMYNYAAGQTGYVAYNPSSGCGGTNITMSTQATAGLYNYTPYQPNQAALNNLNGSGDSCSAYGNRNFWVYFWNWFGNPIGAEYAWLIQSFTYSGGDNNLTVNTPETVTLKALNVSRHPWYRVGVGNNPVRLGTWNPADGPSQFAHLNGTNNRFAEMQEGEVDPNQVATFTFTLNPSSTGTYVIPMNLVAENATYMSWPGFSPTINVYASPYQWQVQSVTYGNGTGIMIPGTSQSVTVWVKNTGNISWYKSGGGQPPVWLATWPPTRSSQVADTTGGKWPSSTRITQFNEAGPIAPGQTASFQFNVKVPTSGLFYERLNLVAEGQNWFNDAGLTLYLEGGTYSWKPLWSAYSTGGDANLPRGTALTVTVKAQNTGNIPWTNTPTSTNPWPVRLATDSPEDRGTLLYDSSWLRDTRPAVLQESTVQPGQQGTFVFKANIPSSAATGEHFEHFNLVAEGMLWFSDPGFYLYVNAK